ncbi:hypothetical protein ABK040_005025 [Willaertia magna]
MQAIFRRKVAKFNFRVTIQHLMKLPKSGIILYISWKRGKKHKGETKKAFVKDKTAVWEEEIQFKGTLFKNSKGKYKKKFLEIDIHEVVRDKKKKGLIGHLEINLADYSSLQQEPHSETRTFPIELWNGSATGELKVKIESEPRLKANPNDLTTFSDNTTMTDATEDSDDEKKKKKKGLRFGSNKFKEEEEEEDEEDHHFNDFDNDEELHHMEDEEGNNGFEEEEDDLHSGMSNGSNGLSYRNSNSNKPSLRFGEDEEEEDEEEITGRSPKANSLHDDEEEDVESPVPMKLQQTTAPSIQSSKDRIKQLGNKKDRKDRNSSITSEFDVDSLSKRYDKVREDMQKQKRKQFEEVATGINNKANNNDNLMSDDGSFTGDEHTGSQQEDDTKNQIIDKQQNQLREVQERLALLQRSENERTLIDVLIINITPLYEMEIPISAPILYKALRHWDCFTPGNNQFLTKVSTSIQSIVQKCETNQKYLSYWLSVCLNLLILTQKDYPVSHSQEYDLQIEILKRIDLSYINASNGLEDILPPTDNNQLVVDHKETIQKVIQLLSDDKKGVNLSQNNDNILGNDDFSFESPSSQFKNDLLTLINKIFIQFYQDLIKQLLPILFESLFGKNGQPSPNISKLTKLFEEYFNLFKENYIPKLFTQQFFSQIFYFLNCFGFNSLLSNNRNRNYCTMGGGIMLKMCVSTLEQWSHDKKFNFMDIKTLHHLGPLSLMGLIYLRQSSDVMIMNKASLIDSSTRQEVCPILSITQLRKLLECYKADDYDPDEVPSSVLKTLPSIDKTSKPQRYLLDTTVIIKPNFEHLSQETNSLNIMNDTIFQKRLPQKLQEDDSFTFLRM